ncbi:MAG TPA: hypothetical protein DDX51_03255 [Clostridiales bacterium]|nr:hypothetical protein [Clostridiales bacterium]
MRLLEEVYQWTPQDSQTDASFCFYVSEGMKQIRIRFEFSPGTETDPRLCFPPIEKAMNRYYDSYPRALQPMEKESFLPVKNLITISLDKDGVYLGNAHRWATEQEHLISAEQASLGFLPPEKMAGEWHGMLHLHEILSETCTGHLIVEGE